MNSENVRQCFRLGAVCLVLGLVCGGSVGWAEPLLDINPASSLNWPNSSSVDTLWYGGDYSNEGGTIGPETQLSFRLFAPRDYDFSTPSDVKHPLIIYMHDAGMRGSSWLSLILERESLRYWARPEIQAFSPTGGAFVLAPKISQRWTDHPPDPDSGEEFYSSGYSADTTPIADNMELALELVAGLVSGGDNVGFDFATQIDTSRIYIVGPSMGAFAVWDALGRTPDYASLLPSEFDSFSFAAGVNSSGAGPTDRGAAIGETPVWTFLNEQDSTVPSAGTTNMIAAIETAGGEPFFETDPVVESEIFSTDLATILSKKRLLTRFQGQQPLPYSSPHAWTALEWHRLNDQNDYVAQWLFSQQQPVPEPTTFVLLMFGIGVVACRRFRPSIDPFE